jgi:hypothetical protein
MHISADIFLLKSYETIIPEKGRPWIWGKSAGKDD